MKNSLIVTAFLFSSLAIAQFNIPKGLKDAGKKVEKKIDSKNNDAKSVDKTEPQANPTEEKKNKVQEEQVNNNAASNDEVSKRGATYLNGAKKCLEELKVANYNENPSKYNNRIKCIEDALRNLKISDPNYDVSAIANETAKYKNAVTPEEGAYDYLRAKALDYRQLYETESDINHSSRSSSTPILLDGKSYEKAAAAFDRVKITAEVEKYMEKDSKSPTIQTFKKDLADYENYITYSGILTYANKLAERSYELSKQKNTPKAVEAAENAKGYCNGVLALSPNYQEAKTALAFADKAYNNASASVGQGLSGNFHKSNVNKIVFSKKPLVIGSENTADVSTTFRSNDEIYGTIYFSDKMANILREGGTKFYTTISINGEKIHFYDPHVTISADEKQNSYLQFALVPPDNYDYSKNIKGNNSTILDFNKHMIGKAPVSFKIKLEGEIAKTDETLQGEFTYDISGGVTKNEKIQQKMEDLFAEAVRLPKPAQSNPELLAKMTQGMNEKGKGVKYTNGRITSGDWKINKNDLGIIIDRTMSAYFVATYPDGHCEMVGNIFIQEYAGNGTYGGLRVLVDPFESKRMNCANATK